jgi:flagellar biosynthesis/type III secretory pathway protein FliH
MSKDDIFDDIIMIEDQLAKTGHEEGVQHGRAQGSADGFQLGYEQGFEVGAELAYYASFVNVLKAVIAVRPNQYSARLLMKLLAVLYDFSNHADV